MYSDGQVFAASAANKLSRPHPGRGASSMTHQALTKKQSHREGRNADAGETSANADISSTSNGDETRRRLEFELAIVLARQPKHQSSLDPEDSSGKGPMKESGSAPDVYGAHSGTSDTAFGDELTTAQAGADMADGDQDGAPSQSVATRRQRWLKSARRTTRTRSMATVASFAITLLVTVFILSLVAVFLFGLPASLSHIDGATGATSARQTSHSAKRAEPNPVAARSSWTFQGR